MDEEERAMQVVLALSAKKLARDDGFPGRVYEDIYVGSIGCAFESEDMQDLGITHILCCAAKIKPRFPDDFKYLCLNALDSPS